MSQLDLFAARSAALMNSSDLEAVLGVKRTTLWRLRKRGLPFTRVGGQVRFDVEQVREWLKADGGAAPDSVGADTEATVGSDLGGGSREQERLPPCHWSLAVALDPKHRPQSPDRPSTTVRREWWRFPQEAHLLDERQWRYRRLLAEEIAVLQGFPKDWGRGAGLGELDLIRGYGNAVPPPLAEVLVSTLGQFLDRDLRTSVEICAGFGGLALGASRASVGAGELEHLALLDVWKPAIDVLRSSGPWARDRVHCADVKGFGWTELRGKIDLLTGGPPCQPWSQGGQGLGAADDRDLLGFMPKLVAQTLPRAFIFENVPGLLSGTNRPYAEWLGTELRQCCQDGYGVAIGELVAADFGVPQVRRRVFIVGILGARDSRVHDYFDRVARLSTHADPRKPLPNGRSPWVTLGEAIPTWSEVPSGWREWIKMSPEQVGAEVVQVNSASNPGRSEQRDSKSVVRGIGIQWPSRGLRPEFTAGTWAISNQVDEAPALTTPLIQRSAGAARECPWYVSGNPLDALDSLHQAIGRRVELVYLDAPRLSTDAGNFDSAEGHSGLDTWLTLMQSALRRVPRLLSDDGVLAVLAGPSETPYIQILMNELMGSQNYVGTVVWQKGYGPQNMPNVREFYETHDNLVVFARRRDAGLTRLALRVPQSGYSNPDGDPRGPWNAEQKGASKPDCDYSVNIPPYEWRLVSGSLPSGVWRVSPKSGVIWGDRVVEVGTWRFVVEVSDSAGAKATAEFEIHVSEDAAAPAPAPPTWLIHDGTNEPKSGGRLRIANHRLPDGRLGSPYYACLQAIGGTPWIGQTRPGKTSSADKGRYWEYPAKTLLEAAAEDNVDFKKKVGSIPVRKNRPKPGTNEAMRNQVTTWLGGAWSDSAGARTPKDDRERSAHKDMLIGYSEDAKVEIDRLRGDGVVARPCKISKPSGLVCRLLALFSREHGVVVDVGSPAAEMASHAAMLGRQAIYVELPGDPAEREQLRLPRLELAARGAHPTPKGVLFSSSASELPEGSGYIVGSAARPVSPESSVCQFVFGAPFGSIDRESGSVLIDYGTYPPGSPQFLRALASIEGLIAEPAPTASCFARDWDGLILATYLNPEVVLDDLELDRVRSAHRAHLDLPSRKIRLYYHRGHDSLARAAGLDFELRRLPFSIHIARGGQ
jgi:excisionase family DNA binding protein